MKTTCAHALSLVLRKVDELELEMGICGHDALFDAMYMEHGIRRKRMARLVVRLASDGLIRSVEPGYFKRVK